MRLYCSLRTRGPFDPWSSLHIVCELHGHHKASPLCDCMFSLIFCSSIHAIGIDLLVSSSSGSHPVMQVFHRDQRYRKGVDSMGRNQRSEARRTYSSTPKG